MEKNFEKLVKLSDDIMDILGIEDEEVFVLKDLNGHILDDWFRYNNFGIEYFDKYRAGWVECASPSITEVLNGTCEVVKCKPKLYSYEIDILKR